MTKKILLIAALNAFSIAASARGIVDIKSCSAEAKVAVVTMSDGSQEIRTVSPLGRPRLWSLEADFTKKDDNTFENDFLEVKVANGVIVKVTIKKLSAPGYNCSNQ